MLVESGEMKKENLMDVCLYGRIKQVDEFLGCVIDNDLTNGD